MRRASLVSTLGCRSDPHQGAAEMLYARSELSRQRLDVHVLVEEARTVEVAAVRPEARRLRPAAQS